MASTRSIPGLAIALLVACGCGGSGFSRARFYAARTVAHEMGALDGNTYLSCRECFEHSYARGQRYLEADLMLTPDGKVVAAHNDQEARFGLSRGFTSQQFMATRLLGRYTPLDGPGLAALMKEKRDWYLIADVKTPLRPTLVELCDELAAHGVECRDRVLPQITHAEELAVTRSLGFTQVIFALYRLPLSAQTLRGAMAFASRNGDVLEVLIPLKWWKVLGPQVIGRSPAVPVYVHTVNDPAQERALFAQGVTGVYSDSLPPARWLWILG